MKFRASCGGSRRCGHARRGGQFSAGDGGTARSRRRRPRRLRRACHRPDPAARVPASRTPHSAPVPARSWRPAPRSVPRRSSSVARSSSATALARRVRRSAKARLGTAPRRDTATRSCALLASSRCSPESLIAAAPPPGDRETLPSSPWCPIAPAPSRRPSRRPRASGSLDRPSELPTALPVSTREPCRGDAMTNHHQTTPRRGPVPRHKDEPHHQATHAQPERHDNESHAAALVGQRPVATSAADTRSRPPIGPRRPPAPSAHGGRQPPSPRSWSWWSSSSPSPRARVRSARGHHRASSVGSHRHGLGCRVRDRIGGGPGLRRRCRPRSPS